MKTNTLLSILTALLFIACGAFACSLRAQPAPGAVTVKQWTGGGWDDPVTSSTVPAVIVISSTPGLSTLPLGDIATTGVIASSSAALQGQITTGSTALQNQIAAVSGSLATYTPTSVWASGSAALQSSINTKENTGVAAGLITSASGALDAKIAAKLDASVWNTGSTALAGQVTSAIATATNFTKSASSGLQDQITTISNTLATYVPLATWTSGSTALQTQIATGSANFNSLSGAVTTITSTLSTFLPTAAWTSGSSSLQLQINTRISDAPNDGLQYARQNGSWAQVAGGGTGGATFVLPPRLSGTGAWMPNTIDAMEAGFSNSSNFGRVSLYISATQAAQIGYNSVTGKWSGLLVTSGTISNNSPFVQEAPTNGKTYARADGTWTQAVPMPYGVGPKMFDASMQSWVNYNNYLSLVNSNPLPTPASNSFKPYFTISGVGAPSPINDSYSFLLRSFFSVSNNADLAIVGDSFGSPPRVLVRQTQAGLSSGWQNIVIDTTSTSSLHVRSFDTWVPLVAGSGITITSGTISATGGGGGGSGSDTGYTPISGNITAPGKYLLTGPITNAIVSPTAGMELDLIVLIASGGPQDWQDYGITGYSNMHEESGSIIMMHPKPGYARVRLIYGTRRYFEDEDGTNRTGWHVIDNQNTETP